MVQDGSDGALTNKPNKVSFPANIRPPWLERIVQNPVGRVEKHTYLARPRGQGEEV
jgi:hypothetical protein